MRLAAALALLLLASGARSQTIPERLDAVVTAAHAAGAFEGLVLATGPDSVLYRAAVGEADRRWGVPLTLETRVPIASVTKQMVAVLAAQLAADGALDLDASVADLAPGLLPRADGVTVRYLLTHRSGLPDLDAHADALYRCALDPAAPDSLGSARDVVERLLQGPSRFESGSEFRYNNGDYMVLEVLLEHVTGQPLARLLADRVTGPLGMTSTRFATPEAVEPRLARSYVAGADGVEREVCAASARYFGAGGLISTVGDVERFDRALLEGRLLTDAARRELWASSPETGYAAMGAWTYEKRVGDRAVRVVERRGQTGGFELLNVLLPDSGHALVVVRTAGGGSLDGLAWQPGLADDLVRALLGED